MYSSNFSGSSIVNKSLVVVAAVLVLVEVVAVVI